MKDILREFPFSFETERLLVRGPLPGDGAPIRQLVLESQNELKEWLPWAVAVPDEAGYEANIRQGNLRFLAREDLWMILLLKGTDTIIGGSGLHRIDWSVPKFEIGYWLGTKFTGKGYITEAVMAISDFAFDELGAKRVEIRCDVENVRSAAVAKRVGYALESTEINSARHHLTNALRDTYVFVKTVKSE